MIVRCELCGYEEDMTDEEIKFHDGFIQCPACDDGELEAVATG